MSDNAKGWTYLAVRWSAPFFLGALPFALSFWLGANERSLATGVVLYSMAWLMISNELKARGWWRYSPVRS